MNPNGWRYRSPSFKKPLPEKENGMIIICMEKSASDIVRNDASLWFSIFYTIPGNIKDP